MAMMGTTTTAVKLRTGPGTDKPVLAFLLPKTRVEVLGVQDDWLQVKVANREGYVARNFILLDGQGVGDGFLGTKTEASQPSASAPVIGGTAGAPSGAANLRPLRPPPPVPPSPTRRWKCLSLNASPLTPKPRSSSASPPTSGTGTAACSPCSRRS